MAAPSHFALAWPVTSARRQVRRTSGASLGTGTARFTSLGATGVLFDYVVVIVPSGQSFVRELIAGITTTLPAHAIVVDENQLRVRVDAALVPTRGFVSSAYTVDLWARSGLANNNEISDFAPDNANVPLRIRRR